MLDDKALAATLYNLSDEELRVLEDDLDFCGFTGMPSPLILRVLQEVGELDVQWEQLLIKNVTAQVPQAFR
ncbi:MAG: hypothetical protein AAFY39_13955 [Pseudomonadota bacterium]